MITKFALLLPIVSHGYVSYITSSGPRFNIKTFLPMYADSCVKIKTVDETVLWESLYW